MFNFLARITFDFMLLRRGPQDLPAQVQLLWVIIAVFTVVNALIYVLFLKISPAIALLQSLFGLTFLAGFVWLVLAFNQRRSRFLQSFMAFVLTGMVFNIIEAGPLSQVLPAYVQLQEIVQHAEVTGLEVDKVKVQSLVDSIMPMTMLLLVGYVWRLMVMAHIFHHTLEVSRGKAMAITLMFPALILFLAIVRT